MASLYDGIWYQWTGTATTAATNQTTTQHTNNVWAAWTNSTDTTYFSAAPPRPQATPEQITAHRQRFEQAAERMRQRAEENKKAQKRAEELLLSCLDEEQTEEYTRSKRFRVRGSRGGVYAIHEGTVYQVNGEFTNGRPRYSHSICIHPSAGFPEADCMLTKKLMIETDEDSFRRIGNFSRR